MTPYIVCYLVLVVSLGTGLLLDKLRMAAVIAFVPMFVLIALRGIVGTDSAVYIQSFDIIRYQGFLASSFEPGFTVLVEILSWFFRDSFDILIVLGCAVALIMLAAGLLLERIPLLFMAIVLPYYLLDMTMNGLRYGLAFAIVALGAAALARGWLKAFVACGIIAASIQISSVLLAASLWALMEARIRTFLAAGFGLIVAFVLFGDYVGDKVSQNSDISGIGGISGVAPLLATVLVIAALRVSQNNRDIISNIALLSIFIMQLASFLIARQYYAGLRLQGLFLFLLYLSLATANKKNSRSFVIDRSFMAFVFAAAVILSLSRLKNFHDDVDNLAPFNPYYFSNELSA
ncbi:EpsG family protein [Sphingomonas sp.]|jgi:hypothetical protein|uniref:EpsG family protein n=1 Tax=Sphingomonas sp. TaxID=28214 RepID=UPI0026066698|nr:EpsG family protein [Sphingomonas sp.]MDF2496161.1 hypothetical protein [Sphingomonas sp.]